MALSSKYRIPASSGRPPDASHQVFYDVALRDFGPVLAALALTPLVTACHAEHPRRPLLTGNRA